MGFTKIETNFNELLLRKVYIYRIKNIYNTNIINKTVVLDDDEVYKVLTNYDKDISGSLDYKKFLRENASRMSTR